MKVIAKRWLNLSKRQRLLILAIAAAKNKKRIRRCNHGGEAGAILS